MNILMMTNTFAPIVGGLEKSIQLFTNEFRKKGHRVYIVAPQFKKTPKNERGVIRIPAIQRFQGTDFSINLPIPGLLTKFIKRFKPDIIHSHHPFLVGDMALRLSRSLQIPMVFTYHIMFEQYIDYLPIHSETFKHFVVKLAAGYSNLVNAVIVPTNTVKEVLKSRGVKTPIQVIPTGIDIAIFKNGNGKEFRKKAKIPQDAFLIGYIGRIAPEKNLEFLAHTIAHYLKLNPKAHFLMAGIGPLLDKIVDIFNRQGLTKQFHYAGILNQQDLVDGYHACDVFAFSSQSETQGMVIIEAMAAGVPVIAAQAPVISEFVKDFKNGRLIENENQDQFTQALNWYASLPASTKNKMKSAAQKTASKYSMSKSVETMLHLYENLISNTVYKPVNNRMWHAIMNNLKIETELIKNLIDAGEEAVKETLVRKYKS